MPLWGELLVAAGILIGLLGIVIPVLPGSLLVVAAILVWAAIIGGKAWIIFGVALALVACGEVIKYFVAGKVLRAGGIPNVTVIVGALTGIVGFFVIPVVGLFVGFIVGAMVSELVRTRTMAQAWRGTLSAARASMYTIGIELCAALLAAGVWLVGVGLW
ncbi:DUF456 domain-containing protein [Gordonia sp. NPDC003425]